MKITSTLIFSSLLCLSTLANAGALDGSTFCRSFATDDFGPPRIFKHCVSFKNNIAKDNANTFFGNPPETYQYTLEGNKIFNVSANKDTSYVLKGNTLVNGEIILTAQSL